MEEAEKLSDHVTILHNGSVRASGSVKQIIESRNGYTYKISISQKPEEVLSQVEILNTFMDFKAAF